MKIIQFLIVWSLISSVQLYADLAQAQMHKGQYHGLTQISVRLRSRIFHPHDRFELKAYLGNDEGLVRLMGAHQLQEGTRSFVNGHASGINYMLYYVVMASLAEDLRPLCESRIQSLVVHDGTINERFQAVVTAVCQSNLTLDKIKDSSFLNLWNSVFAYQAPESEYLAWLKFIRQQWGKQKIQSVYVEVMRSMLMHPHFLFQW